MNEEKKSYGNININNVSNSIIGQHVENATIQGTTEKKKKSKEELKQEILDHYAQYMVRIEQLNDLDRGQKDTATNAIWEIKKELDKEQPDEQKIKTIWEPIKKMSHVAAICSAICDLLG